MKLKNCNLLLLAGLLLLVTSCTKVKTEYYPNGKLQSQVSYLFGKENGTAYYYENVYGKLELSVNFKKGKKEGKSLKYHLNNKVECESYYHNDLLEGRQTFYNPMSQPVMEINFHKGLKEGPYREWHAGSDVLKVSGQYKNDMLDGHWEYHDERDITVGEGDFKEGAGVLVSYDPNGQINRKTTYKKSLRDGPEYYYDTQGNVIKTVVYQEERIVEVNGIKTDRE
jgi:antitoxin component YwqK of YwqJK toxin-antitoxin module